MSKIFRHTLWVSVLTCGALVAACQSSSDKVQSGRNTSSVKGAKETALSKAERTQTPATSPAHKHMTKQHSVALTKAVYAKPAADAKASPAGVIPEI